MLCGVSVGCDGVTRQPGLECDQGPGSWQAGWVAAPVWRSGWRRILETRRRDVGYGLSAVVLAPVVQGTDNWTAVWSDGRVDTGLSLGWRCPRSLAVCMDLAGSARRNHATNAAGDTKLPRYPCFPPPHSSLQAMAFRLEKEVAAAPQNQASHTASHSDQLCQRSQLISGWTTKTVRDGMGWDTTVRAYTTR